jgi:hypothetical protein
LELSKVHLIQFSEVDTTMRLADEFGPKQAYTVTLSEIEERDHPYGAALAFQADYQSAGRGQH